MLVLNTFNMYPVYEVPDPVRKRVDMSATTTTLTQLSDALAQHGKDAMITPEYNMAMSDICRFSHSPDGYEVPIINVSGEEEKITPFSQESRIFAFNIELVTSSPSQYSSLEHSYIISGYTSEVDPTPSGRVPEEMVLYISDIHGMSKTYERDATGGMRLVSERCVDNYILANALRAAAGTMGIGGGSLELMVNPSTIAAQGIVANQLSLQSGESIGDNTAFSPSIPGLNNGAQTYRSSVIRPEGLISSITESYIDYHMNRDNDSDSLQARLFNGPSASIQRYANENRLVNSFSKHPLVAAMTASLRGSVSGAEMKGARIESSGRFQLGDLRAAITNPHDLESQLINSVLQSRRSREHLATGESTDNWVGRNGYSTRGSIVAFDIGMRIGPIMSSNSIGRVQFAYDSTQCDAMTPARLHIIPESVGSIGSSDISIQKAQRFESQLKALMFNVTEHGRLPATIIVKAVLGSVTRVEIRVDGDLPEFYTHASFMMSRLHIGLTNDRGYCNSLSRDVGQLYDAVSSGYREFDRRSNLESVSDFLPDTPTTHTINPLDGFINPNGSGSIF